MRSSRAISNTDSGVFELKRNVDNRIDSFLEKPFALQRHMDHFWGQYRQTG